MALQTKTWAVGDYAWGSWSNAYVLELVLTEQSVSTVDNTSQVDYTLRLKSGSQNRFQCNVKSTLTLGGHTVENTENIYLNYNSTHVLLSGTVTVAHNDDGSLAMPLEATIYPNLSNPYAPPNMTISDTWSLTVIPRESTLSATAANIGEVSTVVVRRSSNTFTHAIAVSFGSISGFLTESGGLTDREVRFSREVINFTLPESFYSQIPATPSGACTLTLTTWSGSTQVGDPRTAQFIATAAKSACAPTASMTVTDANEVTAALTGGTGTLVRFCSHARCVLQAYPRKGARLVSATVAGHTATLDENGRAVVTLPAVALDKLPFTVTDSRGYSFTGEAAPAVIPYVKLTDNATVARLTPTGDTALLRFSGNVFTGDFGAAQNTLTCRYRVQTDGAWGDWQTAQVAADRDSYAGEVTLTGLDYQKSYEIHTEVTDAVSLAEKTLTVRQGVPVFDWGKEDFVFHVPVYGSFWGPVCGVYAKWVAVYDGARTFRVKTKYASFGGTNYDRQSIFIMGSANHTPVLGMLTVKGDGTCDWSGTGAVTAAAYDNAGSVTVTLPNGAYDRFLLLSPEFIDI